jgi:HK97 family phage major capsid protein
MNTNEVKALRQKRAARIEEARGVLNEAKDGALSTEQRTKYDAIMADVDALKGRIEAEERVTAEEIGLQQSVREVPRTEQRAAATEDEGTTAFVSTPEYRQAFNQWTRGGVESMTPEQRSVLSQGRVTNTEQRAQTVTTTAGGYLIAQQFSDKLEAAMLAYGSVLTSGATVMNTGTGGVLMYPTVNDTSNVGELLAINTAAASQDVAFGNLQLDAFKYSSKTVLVPFELLQDSEFDVPGLLGRLLGERISRILNQHFTTGTGSGQPNGIVTASNLGVTAAGAAAITADEIANDLPHSLDPSYRKNAKFMFEDATLKAVKKLKDSQNRYLWLPGLAVREPDTIAGYPYIVNQDMGSMATGVKSVIFGDFSKYLIRRVKGIELYRIADKYIESAQVGFVAFARFDADLLDAGTRPVKHLIQA